ncbi:hypothetical protein FH972_025467 [Carpinus fangiana]|uniref:Uncharacterized protein n=1 Tax=Carpinus fangiana TaxID=176857 RepID=A0A5N6L145_9ROSI|nr:hypothetical protein FH972_025467 [Carpinus fangiana]
MYGRCVRMCSEIDCLPYEDDGGGGGRSECKGVNGALLPRAWWRQRPGYWYSTAQKQMPERIDKSTRPSGRRGQGRDRGKRWSAVVAYGARQRAGGSALFTLASHDF